MEASWFAGMLRHPIGIAVLVAAVLLSAAALYSGRRVSAPISPKRLAFGYIGAVVVCLGIAAVSSYVPREEALTKWHVPSENYWEAVFNQFAVLATLLTYFTVLGIAIVGAPVIFAMARRGFGSIPWVLLASVVISLGAALVLVQLSQPSNASFARDAPGLAGAHLLLSLGFSLGAGLPWRRKTAIEA